MIIRRLMDLCNLDGVPGRENAVRAYIISQLHASPVPKEITVDALGNVIVHLIGKQIAPKRVLFDAHMDEVGFYITHINSDGTINFDTAGGIDPQVLFGHRVRMGDTLGVIGGKAIHHCSGDEKNTVPAIGALTIDIGASSQEEAEAMVEVGQCGTFVTALHPIGDGFYVGKAIDDRIGCALLLSLADEQPEYDIWLSFSVQEEIGLRGAKVVGEQTKPDIAIVVDATTAADVVGSDDSTCVCRVGRGAVVSFADRATLYDSELYATVRKIGDKHGIPTQTKNRIAGGNNSGAIQRSYYGVRLSAISLPCRYIHSPSCMGHVDDMLAMNKLLHRLAEELPQ